MINKKIILFFSLKHRLPFYLCGIKCKINQLFHQKIKMKNLFKFGFLALALSLTVVACQSETKTDGADTTAVDTTVVDTTAADTTGAAAPVAATPAAH